VGRSSNGTSVAVDGKIETCWRVPYWPFWSHSWLSHLSIVFSLYFKTHNSVSLNHVQYYENHCQKKNMTFYVQIFYLSYKKTLFICIFLNK
jgi:hypothetical protein